MPRIIFTVINDLTYDHRMHRICNSLSSAGYDVLLVGRKVSSSIPLREEQFRQQRLSLLFSKGKLFYIEYNIRLFFFLLFKKFDVVCGIDLDTLLPCYFISGLKNKKCVYDAHEVFTEVPEVIRRLSIQKAWRRIEKYLLKRIKNFYTVSQSAADYFYSSYQVKFEVICNVPLKSQLDSSLSKNKKFILYQGALNEGRGLEAMIDAMQNINSELVLAGDGDLSQLLRGKVADKKLKGKITFVGKKTPEQLKLLTQQSTIGINLLENKSLNYYYSLANKFFDYVNAGVPQVSMNFPEYQKMNREFEVALLIDDLNPETIVNAVDRLLTEKDIYIRLRENCLLAREEWNWQKEEQKLLLFYSRLK